jgi:hypothetical protein
MNITTLYILTILLCLVNLLAIFKVITQVIKSRTMVHNQQHIMNQLSQVITLLYDRTETKRPTDTETIVINLDNPLAVEELLKQISK